MANEPELAQLRDGIAAARNGDKPQARILLAAAVELQPHNEQAWLWSASVADDPRTSLECLERVLELNPKSERARSGIKFVRARAGVAYAKAGNLDRARQILGAALQDDPNNELALLWLAGLTNAPEVAIRMLERVLVINPHNDHARAGIERLRKKLPAAAPVWRCLLCQGTGANNPEHCPSCGAVTDLNHLDALLTNTSASAQKLALALRRLAGQPDDAHTSLGLALAYLNLQRFGEALPHLRDAARLQPDKLKRAQLQMALERTLTLQRQAAEEMREAARKLILVVDDSPTIRKVVAAALESTGHRVVTACDAVEAMERLRAGTPALIFLDINMPGMDGYQLCKVLRQTKEMAKLPIVMLSGRDGFFSKIRGRFAGATDYITKPFKATDLLRVVVKYCGEVPALEASELVETGRLVRT